MGLFARLWGCKSGKKSFLLILLILIMIIAMMAGAISQCGQEQGETEASTIPETEAVTESQSLAAEETFPFYFQDYDQPWSDLPHGHSTVSKSGCGTVALSMCLTALTGKTKRYTPGKLARYMREHDIETPNLDVDCIPDVCRLMKTGCSAVLYYGNLDLDLVDETLEGGGYIILDQIAETGRDNAQVFAGKNHYLVIRAGNQNEGYYIANPLFGYSKKGSKARYAPQNETLIPVKEFQSSYYYTITKD